jgi:hypothetical protein
MIMNRNDPRRSQLLLAHRRLQATPTLTISLGQLKPFLTREELARIEVEAKAAKESLHLDEPHLPEGSEAFAYWRKVRLALRTGRMADTTGVRKIEATAARQSEAALEHWEAVESEYRHLFKLWTSDDDAGNWDPRWAFLEHRNPLLVLSSAQKRGQHPLNIALRLVIGDVLDPPLMMPMPAKQRDKLRKRQQSLMSLVRRGE